MKESSYKILMVFLMMMLIIIGYLAWFSMHRDKHDISKIITLSHKQIDLVEIVDNRVLDISKESLTEIQESLPKPILAESVYVKDVLSIIIEHTKPIEKNEVSLSKIEDDVIFESQDIEEIMVLGYSGEEAQRIIDTREKMKENSEAFMPMPLNPDIIEKMELAGYSQEEARNMLTKAMYNPKEMKKILSKLN